MNHEQIMARLDEIRDAAQDSNPVLAHELEDELYFDILIEIVSREVNDPRELARLALLSKRISFSRHG